MIFILQAEESKSINLKTPPLFRLNIITINWKSVS
jgi:hypothetical protein